MNANRDALLTRIKNIAARTVDNGCTEAEAMAAASMLSKLLAEHGVSMTDIEIGEERCRIEYLHTGRKAHHEVQFCVVAIAAFADCKIWSTATQVGDRTKSFAFFGLPGDVETAVYLTHLVKAAMDSEVIGYNLRARELNEYRGRTTSHAFLLGMARRIAERLREMKKIERANTSATTGRDLVVVKNAVVIQQFKELGMRLSKGSSNTNSGDSGAYGAGRAAGDRVSFNRAVGQSGGTMLLGGK